MNGVGAATDGIVAAQASKGPTWASDSVLLFVFVALDSACSSCGSLWAPYYAALPKGSQGTVCASSHAAPTAS